MLKKTTVFILFILFFMPNAWALKVSSSECANKGEQFIFAAGECIEYVFFEGEKEESLNIIVHGTWDEGTNTLGRYAPYAETISLSTDISTIAVALPGYSNSSTNTFQALSHKSNNNLAANKEYLNFLATLIQELKSKYSVKNINYIGHSAGAMMGATLTGLKPSLINTLTSVGGRYNIHEVSNNKSLVSIIDVLDGVDKNIKFLLIYGTADKISEPKVTKEFYEIALKKGLNVKLVEVQDGVHLDLDMTDTAIEAIEELLDY